MTALLIAAMAVPFATSAAAPPPKRVALPPPFFPLLPVWAIDMGDGILDGPATDDMRVFVALRGGEVRALEIVSGTVQWTAAQAAVAPLTAGGGMLFVPLASSLVADNAENGSIRWTLPLAGPLSAPVTWDTGWLLVPMESGELIALRAADGHEIWRRSLGSPVRGRAVGDTGSRLFVSLDDGRVLALDLATGQTVWSQMLGGRLSEPSVFQRRVYVGSTTNMFYALNVSTGHIDWKWRAGGDVIGPTPADEHRVYFVSLDNVLRAVSRGGGNQQWRRDVPTRPAVGPILAGFTVIIAGIAPELHGFNVADGSPAGIYKAAGEFAGPPLMRLPARRNEPAVFLASRDGTVLALMPEPPLPVADPALVFPPFDEPPFGIPGDPALVPLDALPGFPLPLPFGQT